MFRTSFLAVGLMAAMPLLAQTGEKLRSVPRAQIIANAEMEFTKVDSNKDGDLSRAEIETSQNAHNLATVSTRNAAVFKRLDSDKNGQLSAMEFAKLHQVPKADVTVAFLSDTNKDERISRAEHRAATASKFDQLDRNKDSVLTAEEVRAGALIPGR